MFVKSSVLETLGERYTCNYFMSFLLYNDLEYLNVHCVH